MRVENIARDSRGLSKCRSRLRYLAASFAILYLIIILRLLDLTVMHGGAIRSPHINSAQYSRPDILDRNGIVLATSLALGSLYANPSQISNLHSTAKHLSSVLSMQYDEIYQILLSEKPFVWIRRHLPPKERMLIDGLGITGIGFHADEKRVYPQGNLFSHLLGYVDTDGLGISGIEKYVNGLPLDTDAVKLTVDLRVQNVVRNELSTAIAKYEALSGVGIVLDSRNGEIIAMVSLPDFDSNNQSKATAEQKFNHATLAVYEMGSVFKIFTIAAALDSDNVKINDTYDVSQPLKIGRFQITDFHKSSSPEVSVRDIFVKSSNIGMAKIALQIGKEKQIEYLARMNLFSPLAIEIPEKSTPIAPKKWNDSNVITVSYGYGMAVTPLHVVQAAAALVNHGIMHPATLLFGNASISQRVITENTSAEINELLRMVVKWGTGKKAEAKGYSVGGKTGSAEKIINGKYNKNANVSSFVGVFPMNSPQYVALILIDEPHNTQRATGGEVAAPVVKNIINRIAPILNVLPVQDTQ